MARKSGLGVSYVIGPNGKRVSLKDRVVTRRLHGRKADKLAAGVKKDVWKDKYMLKSN